MNSAESKPRLYGLVIDNGLSISPYVWRIRYALAHKGLLCETVSLGFTEISKAFNGRFKTVPVIEQGDTMLAESWDIAEHLDQAFPGHPALFAGPAEHAMVRLTDAWFSAEILRKIFFIYVLDIHNAARPEDRAYFRRSREERLKGRTLEQATADRDSQLPALRGALAPLRAQLSRFPYLGGPHRIMPTISRSAPSYGWPASALCRCSRTTTPCARGSTEASISTAASGATRACMRCSNSAFHFKTGHLT